MSDDDNRVTVRMYNVGFGDAFLVTVHRDGQSWRMLVDCGVHKQGQVHSIESVVETIIADLKAETPEVEPHLDVVVATHRHADHISGFARHEWEEVTVGEVWLSYVEDADDSGAQGLRESHDAAARALLELIEMRMANLDAGAMPREIFFAKSFALNSLTNQDALDRLLGISGSGFAKPHTVRFFPSTNPEENRVTPLPGVTVHMLGPSRDQGMLKRMHPPKRAGWLRLGEDGEGTRASGIGPLFAPWFRVPDEQAPEELRAARRSLNLAKVTNDAGILSAAALLERVMNNTSVFFVLDVAGTRLLFPGDAQHGAWEHVLADEQNLALIKDCAFYKIGHHGSHNSTPREFVRDVWQDGAYAMLPWGLVKRWQDTIPKRELMDALDEHGHKVIRIDDPLTDPDRVEFHDDWWSQLTIPTQ